MAVEDLETFSRWEYLPDQQAFAVPGTDPSTALGITELTNGRVKQRGNILQDASTGRIVGNIAPRSGTTLEVGSQGTILLNNFRPLEDVLDIRRTPAIARVEIRGNIVTPSGQIFQPQQRMVTLQGNRKVTYVDDRPPITAKSFTVLDRGIFGEVGPPQTNQYGRIATATELLQRALLGWVVKNGAAAIDRLKITGMDIGDGTISTNGSEIAKAIAASVEVSPVVTYILGIAP